MPLYTKTDIAWLAGIFDGEGWVGIYCNNYDRPSRHFIKCGITNQNVAIINKIKNMLKFFNINVSITYVKQSRCYNIQIQAIDSVKHFLKIISPYVVQSDKAKKIYEILFFDYEKRTDGKRSNRKRMKHIVQLDLFSVEV
jgi:hypothetical protein